MNNVKHKKRNQKTASIFIKKNSYDLGGAVDKGMGVLSGVMGAAEGFLKNNEINSTAVEQAKSTIETESKKDYSGINSLDDAFNAWNTKAYMKKDYNMKDFRGSTLGQQLLNTGKGVLSGAEAGNKFGPVGGIIGGAVGLAAGVAGIFSGNARAKKAARETNFLAEQGEERQEGNILANMESAMGQQNLNYALNYSKFGGPLHTKGGIFDTGLSFIDEGYTHEDNMYGGVPMGVDPEGNPNLVEEGEVVLNNNGQKYVFSNSVYATEDILAQFGLPKKYANASYAYIVDKVTKEEMETPNDPISKRSLDDKMMRIIYAQEMTKAKQNKNKNKKQLSNVFEVGGLQDNIDEIPYEKEIQALSKEATKAANSYFTKGKPKMPEVTDDFSDVFVQADPVREDPVYNRAEERAYNQWKNNTDGESLARYASLINTGLGLFENRKPDMTGADMIARERAKEIPIGYSPLTQYMTPKPFDRAFYLNKMYGNAAGSRASIRNSAGNRAQALGTLVASDYNTLGAVGDLNRQAEEYNYNNYKDVLDFNRATDIQNLNTAVQANSQRLQQRGLNAELAVKEAALRDAAIAAVGQARSNNRNAFAEDLSNIGRENFIFDMINKNSGLIYQLDKDGSTILKNASTKKCGGKMLTKKRRK